jgi:pimeloyl-ACP methyl ester carboxylesterase
MTSRRRFGAALLALGLLAACTSSGGSPERPDGRSSAPAATDATRPPSPDLARFYQQRLVWNDCKGGFECTRLVVPIDYAHPADGTMRIAVNRRPASGVRLGSLLVNPGGPGSSGLAYVRSGVVSKAIGERYDVVGFDPRGVGASRGMQCLTDHQLDDFMAYDGSPDHATEEQGLLRQGEVLGTGCEKADSKLLPHVGTTDVARDLDVLRAALGDRRLTYLGKSYGTFLGATYAGLFPKRVGRMVLDGPLDPASSALEVARLQAIGFQRALDAFVDDCLARSSCPLSGDRAAAETRLGSFLDGVDSAPLKTEGKRRVTQSLAVLGVAVAMYDKGTWEFLRQALSDAFRGDGTALLDLADYYADRGPGGHYTTNANEVIYAVNCLDRPQAGDLASFRSDAAEVAKVAPIFGRYIVWGNLPCTTWPVTSDSKPAPIAAAGSRPILVVGTTRDPATPYEWAQSLSKELDAGHLLTYVGDGHTAYHRGSSCIDHAVDDYLLNDTLPPAGTRCH